MNGISVMACVQTGQSGVPGIYGRENRMQQKYIVISRQDGRGKASASKTGPLRMNGSAGNSSEQSLPAERIEHKTRASVTGPARVNTGLKSSTGSKTRSKGRRKSAFAVRALVLAVIFSGMLAGFQMMTRASSREKEQTYKYYTTVTIGYGEDLSDIVYQYCDRSEYASADDYVREICDINSLPYQKGIVPDLGAGAKIVIPYYSTEIK